MSTLPTLVFVPGAWHRANCYDKVIKLLQSKHSLKCIAVSLPSTAGDRNATLKQDIEAAEAAISRETSVGRNVVVVAHSYGGLVGASCIKTFTPNNETSSGHGNVVGFVLIASGFTLTGMAFMDPFFGIPPPLWRPNWETGFADIVQDKRLAFYHDCPVEEGEYWVSQLTPQSLKSLYEGGEHSYSGWMHVPAWYIGTSEDRCMPVAVQRINVGAARACGTTVQHRELKTSHSPFLSQPAATAQILREAVENFSGQAVEDVTPVDADAKRQIVVASPRILAPFSWFKFGLPHLIGRMMGNGYMFVTWTMRLFRRR